MNKLLELGSKIIELSEEDVVKKFLLDIDFRNRTLMKTISLHNFEILLKNYKVNILLEECWEGIHSRECDGSLRDFSLLTYLATAPVRKLPGKFIRVTDLIHYNFQPNIYTEKYWWQFKFRHSSIQYIYIKDFIGALFMLVLFQYINFKYNVLFNDNNFQGYTGAALQ